MIQILLTAFLAFSQVHPSSSQKPSDPEILERGQGRAADDRSQLAGPGDDDGMMMDDITVQNSKTVDEDEEVELSPTGMTADPEQPTLTPVIVKDVETIMDNPQRYKGQRVSVSGKVLKGIKNNAFVLKSGGMLNNRIEVKLTSETQNVSVNRKDDVLVTGTVEVKDRVAAILADHVYTRKPEE